MPLVIKKRKPMSEETKTKIREANKGKTAWNKGKPAPWAKKRMEENNPAKLEHNKKRMRENNPMSHGGEVAYKRADYKAVHAYVVRAFGKPNKCEKCGVIGNRPKMIHWANISGGYKRERSDWERLCYKCHKIMDAKK
jgi:hypothetical protein